MAPSSYTFRLATPNPCFDLSPHHTRMTACYRDKAGMYHLFTDFIDAAQNTIQSWASDIRQYDSPDLLHWQYQGIAVEKSTLGQPDDYGASSPGILYHNDKIYLFYAGRQTPVGEMNSLAGPGEPGYLISRICLAVAPADELGRITGPFEKKGIVIDTDAYWRSMRVDDPCAIFQNGQFLLYYKGFYKTGSERIFSVGFARSNENDLHFVSDKTPAFSVDSGCEMPRVFLKDGQKELFLRHFKPIPNKIGLWGHYREDKNGDFIPVNLNLFNGAGDRSPGAKTAADISSVYLENGEITGEILACGSQDGILKQWLYDID
ncbi:MAG TPA: hypothetical protein PK629_05540 [Oscillospiraceae bacterium]|nr:hypothetical protein [Oscillospiraceae bacterium]HPF55679.1 hypothetical protein [Clostridiales bacterium]HPK35710.1 hypothetical protein [Oscillospiraceae bacterium]HPR75082.1 hypothetical protein [Oscillospiraceae bacterium]